MRKNKTKEKGEVIAVRVSKQEKAQMLANADRLTISLSDYMRLVGLTSNISVTPKFND